MPGSLLTRLLVALGLVLAMGTAGYLIDAHMRNQARQIEELQVKVANEQAATTAALSAYNSVSAALDAKQAAQVHATVSTQGTTKALASAVAASPTVAAQVVPESYWQAIYGSAKQ
ncbi:hypothetical protein [Ralstonia solanacearum]|uniref:hypothetical protein n=2 Tax=Ralstonia solanacearum TaxID=305 RepID=UPI000AF1BF6C|nr:hypothetical protein [Ralstonia solanacearum]